MKTRKLRDIEVSEIGYGIMGFSHGYGELPDPQAVMARSLMFFPRLRSVAAQRGRHSSYSHGI